MGIERDSEPRVVDEFAILCERLAEAQGEKAVIAALDALTQYLTANNSTTKFGQGLARAAVA